MKNDEGFLDMLDKSTIIRNQYENVIRFHTEYSLDTYTKNLNPQNFCSEGFFISFLRDSVWLKKLIRQLIESRI